jgi:hypothetical protein
MAEEEGTGFFEIQINIYQTVRCHSHHCEDPEFASCEIHVSQNCIRGGILVRGITVI